MGQSYPSPAIPSKRTGAFYAAYFGVLGVVLPFLGPFLSERGLGAVAVGLATAAFSLAKLAYTPFLGRQVDRGWWFPGILSSHMVLAVLASLLLLGSRDPLVLGVALLVVGVGYGTVLPLVEAAVLERPPERGYGFVRWWGSAGFVAVSGVAAAVLGGGHPDAFPILLTAVLVVLGIACLSLETETRPERAPGKGTWVSSAPVWLLLAILTLNQVAHGPYYAFFSIHLREHGLGTGLVAGLWSAAVLAEAVAFVAGGRLERRFGLGRLLGLALALAPIRWFLLSLPPSLPLLVVAQLCHAATFAAAHLAGVQLVQRAVPPGARRNAQALYSGLAFGLGIVVGTAAAGPLYAAVSGSGSFLAAAGLSVLVAAGWFALSRRLPV
ncbi:MAG TPA: MFS transporter [Methylomirabilota bacterium]|nr:MFS transporter [Methylomirabilota bacterium]